MGRTGDRAAAVPRCSALGQPNPVTRARGAAVRRVLERPDAYQWRSESVSTDYSTGVLPCEPVGRDRSDRAPKSGPCRRSRGRASEPEPLTSCTTTPWPGCCAPAAGPGHGGNRARSGDRRNRPALPRGRRGRAPGRHLRNAQRHLAPDLHWVGLVHNALEINDRPAGVANKDDYALFLGPITPERGEGRPSRSAWGAGVPPWLMAGKVSEADQPTLFQHPGRPGMSAPASSGWVARNPQTKRELLAKARCLLFPIEWD